MRNFSFRMLFEHEGFSIIHPDTGEENNAVYQIEFFFIHFVSFVFLSNT